MLCVRGDVSAVSAEVVAPGFADVVIVRGCEGDVVCDCVFEDEDATPADAVVALPAWTAEWARNAAMKFAKKGR